MPLNSSQIYHGWQVEGPPCFSACLLGVVEPGRDQDKLSCTKLRMDIKVRIEEITQPRGTRDIVHVEEFEDILEIELSNVDQDYNSTDDDYDERRSSSSTPLWLAVYNKLYDLSIPDGIHMLMVSRILDHALSLAKDHHHSNSITNANNATSMSMLSEEDNCKVVRTAVFISVKVTERPPVFPRHICSPATASSIVNLKRKTVVLEGETCVICFEEIRVGSQATLMPCLHLYHRPCLREWLYKTNFCPICRFALPPDLNYRAIEMVD